MLGGIAVLGLLVLISKAITEYGIEAIFKAVLAELRKQGETNEDILEKIDNYPISKKLKRTLREYVAKWG